LLDEKEINILIKEVLANNKIRVRIKWHLARAGRKKRLKTIEIERSVEHRYTTIEEQLWKRD
jgi:hypothetical protein